jgi:hypothetical protein
MNWSWSWLWISDVAFSGWIDRDSVCDSWLMTLILLDKCVVIVIIDWWLMIDDVDFMDWMHGDGDCDDWLILSLWLNGLILIAIMNWWSWSCSINWSSLWLLVDGLDVSEWIDLHCDSSVIILVPWNALIVVVIIDRCSIILEEMIVITDWYWYCWMNWLWTWPWLLTDEVDFIGWIDPDYDYWSMLLIVLNELTMTVITDSWRWFSWMNWSGLWFWI